MAHDEQRVVSRVTGLELLDLVLDGRDRSGLCLTEPVWQ